MRSVCACMCESGWLKEYRGYLYVGMRLLDTEKPRISLFVKIKVIKRTEPPWGVEMILVNRLYLSICANWVRLVRREWTRNII